MRKRTRIFAVVSLLAGLLLGVSIFLATLAPASAHGVDNDAKHHKHKHTQHHTVTTTVTITATPPPPPPPFCPAMPNPAIIGSGAGGSGNPAGNVQFTLFCSNLDPGANYTVAWFFPTCTNGVLTVNAITTGISNTGATGIDRPDLNGHLQASFQFSGCTPGTSIVNLTNNTTGAVTSTIVTLNPPSAGHKK